MLLALSILILIIFPNAEAMANAYGVTIVILMVITTVLASLAIHAVFKKPLVLSIMFGLFLVLDSLFVGSVLIKVPHGGWIALLIALVMTCLLLAWGYGENLLRRQVKKDYKGFPIATLSAALKSTSSSSSGSKVAGDSASGGAAAKLSAQKTSSTLSKVSSSVKSSGEKSKSSSKSSDKSEARSIKVSAAAVASPVAPPSTPPALTKSQPLIVDSSDSSVGADETVIVFQNKPITVARTPGLGIFTASSLQNTPLTFENFIRSLKFLPSILLFVKVEKVRIAHLASHQRYVVKQYPGDVYSMRIFVGFAERLPNLFREVKEVMELGLVPKVDPANIIAVDGVELVDISKQHSFLKRAVLLLYEQLKSAFPQSYAKNMELDREQTLRIDIPVKM